MGRLAAFIGCCLALNASAAEPELREQAETALRRGVAFFRTRVAVHGTYLWQYSADLSQREGEGVATATQGWVQPPGTPAVGLAFLSAWRATSDAYYLQAARETAHGLVRGQLRSGGWTCVIDFSPEGRRQTAYRDGGGRTGRNVTTLDDDTTQCALRFLMQTDQALGFEDATLRESIEYALNSLLQAQYPNGAWPQGFERPPDPGKHPVKRADYPKSWPRTWPGNGQYWFCYTLNDNSLGTTVETLFECARIYRDAKAGAGFHQLAPKCRAAAEKAGGFLLLSRMPEPQPGWAQQYDFDMHPAWARRFEPPSVTGGESQGILRALLSLYCETSDRKYLEPVPHALDYFRRSRLPDGRLARFYELRSNRPLYFTKDYLLTYQDNELPTHYAFKVGDWTEAVAREYERVQGPSAVELESAATNHSAKVTPTLVAKVKSIIAAQDAHGRWVEGGGLRYHQLEDPTVRVINCATFKRNVEVLSRYLAGAGR